MPKPSMPVTETPIDEIVDRYQRTWPSISGNRDQVLVTLILDPRSWRTGQFTVDPIQFREASGHDKPMAESYEAGYEAFLADAQISESHRETMRREHQIMAKPGITYLPDVGADLLLGCMDLNRSWSPSVEQAWHASVDAIMAYDHRRVLSIQRYGIPHGSPASVVNRGATASAIIHDQRVMRRLHATIAHIHERKGWATPACPAWADPDSTRSTQAVITILDGGGIDRSPSMTSGDPITHGCFESQIGKDAWTASRLPDVWQPAGSLAQSFPDRWKKPTDAALSYIRTVERLALDLFPGDHLLDDDAVVERQKALDLQRSAWDRMRKKIHDPNTPRHLSS
jgi:hypothetical protein